jgi:hypothetical protein
MSDGSLLFNKPLKEKIKWDLGGTIKTNTQEEGY